MRTADDTKLLHTTVTVAGNEVRPVRLLVPTVRRGDYYVSPEDTLIAANLGITRATTDEQLLAITRQYEPRRTEALRQFTVIRDGLAHPRDIAEAFQWGLVVPITAHENSEEENDDPTKRLGWWWVYDLTRYETREQRRERYLNDKRLVDTKGLARLFCRSYLTTRDLKVATDTARKVIADAPGARMRAVTRFRNENPGYDGTDTQLIKLLIERAHDTLVRGTPVPADVGGQSDLFAVSTGLKTGRTTKKLDEWYCYTKGVPTGRPRGAATRHWKKSRKTTSE